MKCAVVTGGGKGIGKVIAKRLNKTMTVFIVGRELNDLLETSIDVSHLDHEVFYLAGDLTEKRIQEELLTRINSESLEVECLIHNAGCGRCFLPHEFPEDEFRKIFELNVHVQFALNKIFLPGMIERKSGKIVFIGSSATHRVVARDSAYSASKAASLEIMKGIARDYRRDGIIACTLSPHFVEGAMMDRTIASYAKHKGISFAEAKKVFESKMPKNKFIQPEEIAELVADFCSGALSYASGTDIPIA